MKVVNVALLSLAAGAVTVLAMPADGYGPDLGMISARDLATDLSDDVSFLYAREVGKPESKGSPATKSTPKSEPKTDNKHRAGTAAQDKSGSSKAKKDHKTGHADTTKELPAHYTPAELKKAGAVPDGKDKHGRPLWKLKNGTIYHGRTAADEKHGAHGKDTKGDNKHSHHKEDTKHKEATKHKEDTKHKEAAKHKEDAKHKAPSTTHGKPSKSEPAPKPAAAAGAGSNNKHEAGVKRSFEGNFGVRGSGPAADSAPSGAADDAFGGAVGAAPPGRVMRGAGGFFGGRPSVASAPPMTSYGQQSQTRFGRVQGHGRRQGAAAFGEGFGSAALNREQSYSFGSHPSSFGGAPSTAPRPFDQPSFSGKITSVPNFQTPERRSFIDFSREY